jgi:hypothetical protein
MGIRRCWSLSDPEVFRIKQPPVRTYTLIGMKTFMYNLNILMRNNGDINHIRYKSYFILIEITSLEIMKFVNIIN